MDFRGNIERGGVMVIYWQFILGAFVGAIVASLTLMVLDVNQNKKEK